MAREQSDLIPGTFDLLILKALSLGDLHGWGVAERIERLSGGVCGVKCHRTLKCGHGGTLQNRPGSGVGSMRDASAFINRRVDTRMSGISVVVGCFGLKLSESTA